jgi:hypothetical protein
VLRGDWRGVVRDVSLWKPEGGRWGGSCISKHVESEVYTTFLAYGRGHLLRLGWTKVLTGLSGA